MKRLKFKHNLYGILTALSFIALFGLAGSSDTGRFENTALLFAMAGFFLFLAVASFFLFRATGAALSRHRAKIMAIRRTALSQRTA